MNPKVIDYETWRTNMIQYCKDEGLVASECDSCNGTLFVICHECDGEGEIVCSHCGHCANCSECDGEGTIPCEYCNKSGIDISEYSYHQQIKKDLEAYALAIKDMK